MAYPKRKYARSGYRRTNLNRSITRSIRNSQETKVHRTSGTFVADPSQFTNVELNNLGTGSDNGKRIGDKVLNTRLRAQLVCTNTGPARVVIYCPKAPNASIPTTTAFGDIDPSEFWCLYDRVLGQGPTSNGFTTVNINKKLNFHTKWAGNSSNGFSSNPLKMYLYYQNVGEAIIPNIRGNFSVFYKDG